MARIQIEVDVPPVAVDLVLRDMGIVDRISGVVEGRLWGYTGTHRQAKVLLNGEDITGRVFVRGVPVKHAER